MIKSIPKILIVDDRHANLVALEKVLQGLDVAFVRASSGNAALQALLDHEFAMVLIDVQMPGMDGYETVDLMRQDKRFRQLPVIFLSAVYRDDDHKIRAARTGAVDFLSKPVIPEILRAKVTVFLDLYNSRRAMQLEIERRKASEEALKRAQQALEEANTDLERKVAARTQALKSANDSLTGEIEIRTSAEQALREAQVKIVETEKIAALGTLTAGIAHELNNPLMGILNFVQYAVRRMPEESKVREVLHDAEQATTSCIDIVKNLLTFARVDRENTEPFAPADPAVLFDRVLRLLSYRIDRENAVIRKDFDAGCTGIPMKVNAFQQVLLNLVGNAMDAVQETRRKEIILSTRIEDGHAVIRVSDSGCGVAPEHRQRIFDPFFTTKPAGKGTGLGLSVTRGIIDAHGGSIQCLGGADGKTVFAIHLPAGDDK